jgi:cytochrome c oxidase subunit 2
MLIKNTHGMAVAHAHRPVRSVFVTFVTAVLAAAVVSTDGRPQDEKTEPETKTFEVVARRFAFEPDTIEVNEGDRVRLLVRSADGPHGVEIKQFKVKKAVPRAKPGDSPVEIEFTASAAGTFPILCSEYCGNGHKDMTGTLVVHIKSKEPNETPN